MNLLSIIENRKSNPPKKAATATETPTTIKVYFMVSFLVGQLTFFISSFTSFKKGIIFLERLVIFIGLKNGLLGQLFNISQRQ